MLPPSYEVRIVGYDYGWVSTVYDYKVGTAALNEVCDRILEFEQGGLVPDYYVVYDGNFSPKSAPDGYMFSLDKNLEIVIMDEYKDLLTIEYLMDMYKK